MSPDIDGSRPRMLSRACVSVQGLARLQLIESPAVPAGVTYSVACTTACASSRWNRKYAATKTKNGTSLKRELWLTYGIDGMTVLLTHDRKRYEERHS